MPEVTNATLAAPASTAPASTAPASTGPVAAAGSSAPARPAGRAGGDWPTAAGTG